ncbi:MAG: hypothetical protein R6W83_11010 [Cryobacterium sp.]
MSEPYALSGHCTRSEPRRAPATGVPDRVAGYRVGRRLGAGSWFDIFLGHSDRGTEPAVALKIFAPQAPPDLLQREVRALCAGLDGTIPGVTRLLDVATLADGGTCLVLERLEGQSLAHYLDECDTLLLPGEAVTILAPVLAALSGLHDAGFAHTRLSQATVWLDQSGRPVLLGLGTLGLLPENGPERTALLRADYERMTVLLRGTVERLDPAAPNTRQAADLVARCAAAATASPLRPCLPQLERILFDWAASLPLHPSSMPAQLASTAQPEPETGTGADSCSAATAEAGATTPPTERRVLHQGGVTVARVLSRLRQSRLLPLRHGTRPTRSGNKSRRAEAGESTGHNTNASRHPFL